MSGRSLLPLLRLAACGLALLALAACRAGTADQPADAPAAEPALPLVLRVALSPLPSPMPLPPPTPTPSPTPTATPTPTPTPSPTPSPPPPAPPPTADGIASAVVTLTNELRADSGLSPLGPNPALSAAAAAYARLLALSDWWSHQGPDGSTIASRVEAAGYTGWTYLAENLYRGPKGASAASIVEMWVASPGHRSSMLSPQARETGVGCYQKGELRWCVQIMGSR